ncbi:MAG TPA: xanthine dehydrogenase family protein molybdopterin-binding subunit [Gemmatimonadales bacterium]|nr:xanthine dehydrogenase family protein molybdopterin-binding subunit [Gemmatimonadales bacterium]
MTVSRRDFVKTAAATGAGLTLAVYFQGCGDGALSPDGALAPNAFLRLLPDGAAVVIVGRVEMGQGATTGLAMALAEELDCDWSRVSVEQAHPDKAFRNPLFWNLQVTGISTSIRQGWRPMREAGATARAMLVAAAASRWGVTAASCRTEGGRVHHDLTGRALEYGDLVSEAAALPVPREAPLKDPRDFRLVGKRLDRLDGEPKVRGTTTFGIDVRLPGMAYASVERCPVPAGQVGSVAGEAEAMAVPGVLKVIRLEDRVAVVAEHYWQAVKGRRALQVTWIDGSEPALDSAAITRRLDDLLAGGPGTVALQEGDVDGALQSAATTVSARYDLPYLAHATMEPQNCTAWVHDGRVEVWAPTQFQAGPFYAAGGGARGVAATGAGVSTSDVTINTTFLGGGFGRRLEVDYVGEAARIARELDRPVQVIWSREDDMRHDFFRPVAAHALTAALGGDGLPLAWRQSVATPSVARHWVPWIPAWALNLGGVFEHGADIVALEGSLVLPYRVPNRLLDWRELVVPVPVGYWRSVGHSHNTFAVESFVDELAHAAGQDPVAYRRALLQDDPRTAAVLDVAAEQSGWGTPPPAGRARGVALLRAYDSVVAQVAEVSVSETGQVRVHRVTCAIDCGTVVNPGLVEAQMQGGIVFGLTAALHGEITLAEGRVQQSNFFDYEMMRMPEAPVVEVHIVPSAEPPGGVGEAGVPPIAPAVANAVFALTGERVRRLPLRL